MKTPWRVIHLHIITSQTIDQFYVAKARYGYYFYAHPVIGYATIRACHE